MPTGTNTLHEREWFKHETLIRRIPNAPSTYATGNQTYTAADLLNQILVHDGTGAANGTLSTAALLVAAMKANANVPRIGDTLGCVVVNGGSGTITLVAGSGGTFDANQQAASQIIAANTSKHIWIRLTAVAAGSEAYVVYC